MASDAVELVACGSRAEGKQFPLRAREVDMEAVASAFGASSALDIWLEDERGNAVMGGLRPGKKYTVCGLAPAADPGLEALRNQSDRPRVGLAYSEDCLEHKPPAERIRGHPEAPQRVQRAREQLETSGLLEFLVPIQASAIDEKDLQLIHSESLVKALLSNHYSQAPLPSDGAPQYLAEEEPSAGEPLELPSDTYTSQGSRAAVMAAVSHTVTAATAVMSGELNSAFCLVRPPGHHCTACRASGGCLVNNVAVAVAKLRCKQPDLRIAIVDFDIHHGNGTQKLFEEDDQVFFISLHRYDAGRFYPHSGAPSEIGSGPGLGLTMNVAFDTTTLDRSCEPPKVRQDWVIGDWQWEVSAQEVLVPVLKAWKPDVLLVSAGFDAARGDPLGKMNVVDGFARVTSHLQSVVSKIVMVLEGGYNSQAVASGVEDCVRVLLGLAPPCQPSPPGLQEQKWTVSTLLATMEAHSDASKSDELARAVSAVASKLRAMLQSCHESAE
eukprot:TRINITY_DN106234_c0_g1_i1.p1 TRINITY_DN106234_c0_g1~~TRINITY_DN106234_c0_g1_i1.p1  ORF type:complete len:497 (+),score=107.53 TRINITY_DN106234_c0_g1_i1:36-1526(+)